MRDPRETPRSELVGELVDSFGYPADLLWNLATDTLARMVRDEREASDEREGPV